MAGRERHGDGPGATAFRVQSQIRRNAQDMQEYLTELGSWEKSIKKKDRQLSRKATARSSPSHSSSSSSRRGTPDTEPAPIRLAGETVPVSSGPAPLPSDSKKTNSAATRPSEPSAVGNDGAAGDSGETKSSVSAAGHTYDKGYGKWAKFDIDAALRSVDEVDAGIEQERRTVNNSSSSDSDTDGDDTQEQPSRLTPATMVDRSSSRGGRRPPPQPAAPPTPTPAARSPRDLEKEERERGNSKFAQGDFEGAAKCYTRCVGMNSKSSLAFSNRAMAYLKLKEFGKAEADCDSALRVDPRHVKSLQRRAAARNSLGKHRAALADLQTAAEIDPSSKQVRKDLGKTLETLKAVARRAPKRQVKVDSAPLPAPKPRGYSPPTVEADDEVSPRPAHHQASPTPAPDGDGTAVGAVSATNTGAPVTGRRETAAPFSSVLRKSNNKRTNGRESNVYSYQARTTVEELPEEAEEAPVPAPSTTPAAPANAPTSSGQGSSAASSRAAAHEGRATETAPGSSGTDDGAVEGLAADMPNTGTARAATAEATATGDDATRPPGAGVVAAVGAGGAGRPAVSPVAESDPGNAGAREVSTREGGSGDNAGGVSREARGEAAASSPPLGGRTEAEDRATPARTRPQAVRPPTDAASSGLTAQAAASQLPTTGYQFELMWRSADGSPRARLELLRAVPPSSVAKFFRRTPIEVDLLGGVLRDLGEAFLPRKPATALRWLKSLAKASRFGMTVALLGEDDGRAAAREVLTRLEAAPPVKVDPQDVDALRKQFLVS